MRLAALLLAIVAASAASPVMAGAAASAGATALSTARVTYLAGPSVYVEAGRAEGLAAGDSLDVVRGGAAIARLRVSFISTHRAACDTLTVSSMPRVGDLVRFVPHAVAIAAAPDAAADTGAALASGPMRPRAPASLRGRVAVHWLGVQSDAIRLAQPAFDLWLEGRDVGGSRTDLAADVRARRTSRAVTGAGTQTDGNARAYRLAFSTHDADGRRRLTLGRQSSPLLSSVSLFDGALIEATGRRLSLGVFGGTEPDPVSLAPGHDVIESGGFLQLRQAAQSARRWTVASGGVLSTSHGQVNRQFAFAQGFYRDRALSASAAQELDVNTGWKRATGEPLFSATSSFVTARVDARSWISLQAGYDNRRNVRLYRDRVTPETELDDRYRQGAWGGFSVDPTRAVRVGAEIRTSSGGGARTDAWSASGELWRVLPLQGRLRGRYSQSRGDVADTRLATASLGFDVASFAHLEAGGGMRATTNVPTGATDDARWQDLDLDLTLGRRLFLTGSMERTIGDLDTSLQEDVRLSFRF